MKISSGDSTSGPQAAVGLLNLSAHVPRGTLPGTGIITVSTLINVTRSALSELKTRDKPTGAARNSFVVPRETIADSAKQIHQPDNMK